MASFCDLPEISEEALSEEVRQSGVSDNKEPFWKQYRCIFGFVAQTAYVYVALSIATMRQSSDVLTAARKSV